MNRNRNRLLSALFLVATTFSTTSGAARGETIELGVSHSEYLPAVPTLQSRVAMPAHYHSDSLNGRAGVTQAAAPVLKSATMVMDPQQSPLQGAIQGSAPSAPPAKPATVPATPPTLARPMIEWFVIPAPMAGVWTKRGDLTLSVTDLRTGVRQPSNQWTEDEMTVTWGHQADKQGNIWHANLLPAERDGFSGGKNVKFLTVSQKCEGSAANGIVTRTHYVVSESYGAGGPVADIFQQEALNRYQLLSSSQLQNNSTNRVFAYHGQPVRDGELQSSFNKVGNYTPTQNMHGINLVQSLNDYLRAINRADLAP